MNNTRFQKNALQFWGLNWERFGKVIKYFLTQEFLINEMSHFTDVLLKDSLKKSWNLYLYGKKYNKQIANSSGTLFLYTAGRYCTVGACGLIINYVISFMFGNILIGEYGYVYAASLGSIISINSNFFMNKIWTFEDKNFTLARFLEQYSLFLTISLLGMILQVLFVILYVEVLNFEYGVSLIISIMMCSVINFVLNKRITFAQKIWEKKT
jgi:dolichol-phosphate mannosyltransferase